MVIIIIGNQSKAEKEANFTFFITKEFISTRLLLKTQLLLVMQHFNGYMGKAFLKSLIKIGNSPWFK